MSAIDFTLLILASVIPCLAWVFDVFCAKRVDDKWIAQESCRRFCSKRKAGCEISPESAGVECSERILHDQAKRKFIEVRKVISKFR